MTLPACPERDELERRINRAVRELSEGSRAASKLARAEAAAERFTAIHSQHDLLTERVRVLRECLHLHKDWHGC